jgi:iron complex transport system substrate-binding protein
VSRGVGKTIVATTLVLGMVLLGCGSGDDSGDATSPTPASSIPGSTAEPSVTEPAAPGTEPGPPPTESDPATPETTGGGPRIVEHQYGSTEVPADPQRIVALSEEFLLADLLALGVRPVASTSNDPTGFVGIDPASTEGIEVIASVDFNLEQLAALRPDLILAYPDYIDLVGYDQVNAVAPTVAIGTVDSDWREQFELTASALGLDAEGATVIGDVEAELDEASQVLDGEAMSVASISPGPLVRAYTDERTNLTEIMAELGIVFVPDSGDTDDNGRITLSLEQLGVLSGDTLVLLQTNVIDGEDQAVADIEASPLWPSLPAVESGRVIELDRLAYPGALGAGAFATDLAAAVESAG